MWRRNEDALNVKGCGEGMREPATCQKTLAVPELGGGDPRDARNPWQCQPWLESRYASSSYVGDWVYKISCQKASEGERAGS